MPPVDNDIVDILFSEEQIRSRVAALAQEITADYRDSKLVLVSILRGSVFFATDLARLIELPLSMDFLSISSYGEDSEGVVRITKDLEENIAGKDVLLIEDIIDTGFTLKYLLRTLSGRNPRSLEVCTLLDRRARRIIDMDLKYIGFEIPDKFVVGYGLDYRAAISKSSVYRSCQAVARIVKFQSCGDRRGAGAVRPFGVPRSGLQRVQVDR